MVYHYVVQLRDTDAAGVVYFANLLAICHGAYESSLATAGIDLQLLVTNPPVALPIVRASIDFKQPIYCGDRLQISLTPQIQSESEFSISYRVNLATDRVAGLALTKHTAIDTSCRQRVRIPMAIRDWIDGFNLPVPS